MVLGADSAANRKRRAAYGVNPGLVFRQHVVADDCRAPAVPDGTRETDLVRAGAGSLLYVSVSLECDL